MSLWIQGLHTYVKEKDFKLICVTDDDAEKTYHFTIPDDIVNMRFSMRGHGVLFGSNPSDEKNSVRLNLEINGPYPRVNGRVLVTNVDGKLVDINNEVPLCQSKEERRKKKSGTSHYGQKLFRPFQSRYWQHEWHSRSKQ